MVRVLHISVPYLQNQLASAGRLGSGVTITLVFERIRVENYKCLVDFDLYLQDITLLVGLNGVGKTAVLDVIYGIRRLLAGEVKITDPVAFPPSTLTRWQTHRHQQFGLRVRVGGEAFAYRLRVEHGVDSGAVSRIAGAVSRIAQERLTGEDGTVLFSCQKGEVQLFRDDGSKGPSYMTDWGESALARVVPHPTNTRLSSFLAAVRDTVVCTIRPYGLRSDSTREDGLLDRYDSNFVAWYRHAVLENPSLAGDHAAALRPVIQGFDDLYTREVGLDARAMMLRFAANTNNHEHGDERYQLLFGELSDGQCALVVLYGLLHLGSSGGGIWFLDEPDNYVAIPEVQPWLMALVELCEETPSQAVICSHHPELIDYLGPAYGQVLRCNSSGATTTRPLRELASGSSLKLSELVARGWDT